MLFAPVMPVAAGCVILSCGVAAIAGSRAFTANARYMSGTLRSWSWITLIIGAPQLLAVAALGPSAVGQMLVIPAYPACLLMIIAMDMVALYSPTARAGPPEPMMRRGQRAVVAGKGPGGGGRR